MKHIKLFENFSINESRYAWTPELSELIKSKYKTKKTSEEGISMYVPLDSNNNDILGYVYDKNVSPTKSIMITPENDEFEKFLVDNGSKKIG